MLKTFEGIYRNGIIELSEKPDANHEGMEVIVTFLDKRNKTSQLQSLDKKKAAELRARLSRFIEDWDNPEMDIYNNYDDRKPNV